MNKTELIKQVASESGLTQKDCQKFMAAFEDITKKTISEGEKIVLPDFISFLPKMRKEKVGRNPKTGEALQLPATRYVKLVLGKGFKEMLAD